MIRNLEQEYDTDSETKYEEYTKKHTEPNEKKYIDMTVDENIKNNQEHTKNNLEDCELEELF